MKSLLTFMIPLVLLFISCKKDDHPCKGKYTHTYYEISSSLDAYRFKENTYWVYQNDLSGQLDSQRVVSTLNGQIGSGGSSSCGSTYAERYQISVKSFLNNHTFSYVLLGSGFYKDTLATPYNNMGKYIFSNTNSFSAESEIQLIETIPSITINGNTLTNVKKILVKPVYTDSHAYNLSNHDMHFYFANAVGIVKWEVMSGSTILDSWSIRSWQVIL